MGTTKYHVGIDIQPIHVDYGTKRQMGGDWLVYFNGICHRKLLMGTFPVTWSRRFFPVEVGQYGEEGCIFCDGFGR